VRAGNPQWDSIVRSDALGHCHVKEAPARRLNPKREAPPSPAGLPSLPERGSCEHALPGRLSSHNEIGIPSAALGTSQRPHPIALISACVRDQKISPSADRIVRSSPQIIAQSPSDSSKTRTIACFLFKLGALFRGPGDTIASRVSGDGS
jgi:hypothetical protein